MMKRKRHTNRLTTALVITPSAPEQLEELCLDEPLRSCAQASGLVHTPQDSCTRLRPRAHVSGRVHTPQMEAPCSLGAMRRIPCDEITVNRHVLRLLEGVEPTPSTAAGPDILLGLANHQGLTTGRTHTIQQRGGLSVFLPGETLAKDKAPLLSPAFS
ncbi:unnamed protein product [Boreogadus saida]